MILLYGTLIDPFKDPFEKPYQDPFKGPYLLGPMILQVGSWEVQVAFSVSELVGVDVTGVGFGLA